MHEKYEQRCQNQIILLAESKIKSVNYKIFDHKARIIKRDNFPELVENGEINSERCLVVGNSDGETIVIAREFEHIMRTALRAG